MQKTILFLSFLLLTRFAYGQGKTVEMADTMRSNGKIYVVLAVVLVIFAGFIIYLISIDRKVRKMEREQEKK